MVSEKRLKRSLYLFYSAYRWAFLAYCVYQLILILLEFTSMGLERYKFLIAYWAPLNLKIALEETVKPIKKFQTFFMYKNLFFHFFSTTTC